MEFQNAVVPVVTPLLELMSLEKETNKNPTTSSLFKST